MKDENGPRLIHPSSSILHPFLCPSARCYRLPFPRSITTGLLYAPSPACEPSGNAGPAWGRRNSGRSERRPDRQKKKPATGGRRRLNREVGGLGSGRGAAGERPRGKFG